MTAVRKPSAAAPTPAIGVTDVTKRFGVGGKQSFTAVQNVSFDLMDGEFVSLVGPSGCGKSTLLNMISGLDPPTEGTVEVDGQVVGGTVRSDVGFLFQKDAALPWKTVWENVELPLIFRKEKAARRAPMVEEWLARVGLSKFAKYYPHQLSGGMRKRVSLAATFIYNPRILLMDEPFSALDVQTRNMMENELLDLWQEHRKTVLFVTHDLEEAISLSDRVVVMTAGPGRVKREFSIGLPRPRNVNEIRFDERFRSLHEQVWATLREEVEASYRSQLSERG